MKTTLTETNINFNPIKVEILIEAQDELIELRNALGQISELTDLYIKVFELAKNNYEKRI